MKRQLLFLLTFALLTMPFASNVNSPNSTTSSTATSFIVFSDTHVGRGVGGDGLDGAKRLQKLLLDAGKYKVPMINLGDLTDGWFKNNARDEVFYNQYKAIVANYSKSMEEIKGNHDCNSTKFTEKLGRLNWVYRWNDMLFVGAGCLSESGEDWISKGISYNATTYSFLASTVKCLDYNATKYHFLFMHFAPDSVWPGNEEHGVSARFSSYMQYFTMVFHGHEGGIARVKLWNNVTPTVKTDHLGDGKNVTDAYLFVHLTRSTNRITIVSHNFVTGNNFQLYEISLPLALNG